jgi:hypothetical protein
MATSPFQCPQHNTAQQQTKGISVQLVLPNESYQSLETYLDTGSVLRHVARVVGFFISFPMFQTSRAVPAKDSGLRVFAIISCFTFSYEGLDTSPTYL